MSLRENARRIGLFEIFVTQKIGLEDVGTICQSNSSDSSIYCVLGLAMRSTPRHTFHQPELIADSRLLLHPLLLLARQILCSIRKLKSSDALLHILEDAHLYHVLNART